MKITPKIFVLAILLLAFFVRMQGIMSAPPGLTHDEANHGREGISILDGDLRLYYPLNYGSEPMYSYLVAGSMALVGESLFGLRIVGVYFALMTLAFVYVWAKRAFDRTEHAELTAIAAVGAISVSYWALVTSRMALRATLLPFFAMGAIYFFWQLWLAADPERQSNQSRLWRLGAIFGAWLAGTFYIYLASRVLWLIFPTFWVYLLLFDRNRAWRMVGPTVAGLALAGLLTVPMFVYLEYFPESETRLQMLDGTLEEATSGNLAPVIDNGRRALLALFWPGAGDSFLAYNIPGKPVYNGISAVLAFIGLGSLLYKWKRPQAAFVLIWLGVGLIPSLITGPTANTTRNIGALVPIYLLPALGAVQIWHWVNVRQWSASVQQNVQKVGTVVGLLLLVGIAWQTSRDYTRWSQLPDVRAAYQTTIMAAMRDLEGSVPSNEPAVLSSVYPGAAHDSSIARVWMVDKDRPLRWVDARRAIVVPESSGSEVTVYAPSSAAAHPLFASWAAQVDITQMQSTDLDPSYQRLDLEVPVLAAEPIANFGGAIELVSAEWLAAEVAPNSVAELLTVWRVINPDQVGPIVPPIETTDVALFAHVLGQDQTILTQADVADAPSWAWRSGDQIFQIMQFYVPPEAEVGDYSAIVGIYDRASGARLPLADQSGDVAEIEAKLTIR